MAHRALKVCNVLALHSGIERVNPYKWKHCNINAMYNNDVTVLLEFFRINFLLVLYFKVLFYNFYVLIIKLIISPVHFFRNNVVVVIIIYFILIILIIIYLVLFDFAVSYVTYQ